MDLILTIMATNRFEVITDLVFALIPSIWVASILGWTICSIRDSLLEVRSSKKVA